LLLEGGVRYLLVAQDGERLLDHAVDEGRRVGDGRRLGGRRFGLGKDGCYRKSGQPNAKNGGRRQKRASCKHENPVASAF